MRIDRKRIYFVVVEGRPRRVEDRTGIQPLNGSRPFVRLVSSDGAVVAEEVKIQRVEQLISAGPVGIPVGAIGGHIVFQQAKILPS